MTSQRVVASSTSFHVEYESFTTKLIGNPFCVETQSSLPKIYGPKQSKFNIERLKTNNEEEKLDSRRHRRSLSNKITSKLRSLKKPIPVNTLHFEVSDVDIQLKAPVPTEPTEVIYVKKPTGIFQLHLYKIIKQKYGLKDIFSTYGQSKPIEIKRKSILNPLKKSTDAREVHSQNHNYETPKSSKRKTLYCIFNGLTSPVKRPMVHTQEFIVPDKEQLQEIIKNYKPLDLAFDINEVIKSNNFSILHNYHLTYVGYTQDQKPHGLGILFKKDGLFYGKFYNGHKIVGSHQLQYGIYRGHFSHGKRHGYGTFVWNNNEKYEGRWKNGMKHGHGRWTDGQGNSYIGDWVDNKQQGKGVFTFSGSKYVGDFMAFLKHGKGYYWFSNGDHYIGCYYFGRPHGLGRYTWKSGETFTGSFYNGLRYDYKGYANQ